MLTLKFAGMFQCRLSTDTDPPDESRGVSGYAQVLPGEPGMDRVIRFQPPVFSRTHCPPVGVAVRKVLIDGIADEKHPLMGSAVELLGGAKFEGRNGLIAEDGDEPIVPFDLQIAGRGFRLRRSYADQYPLWQPGDEHPYQELRATGVNLSPGEIAEETGIWDMRTVWAERAQKLKVDLDVAADDDERVRIERRLKGLSDVRLLQFYGARMMYFVRLGGTATIEGVDKILPRAPAIDQPWSVEMWFAAWDPDAFQGMVKGYLHIPLARPAEQEAVSSISRARPELA